MPFSVFQLLILTVASNYLVHSLVAFVRATSRSTRFDPTALGEADRLCNTSFTQPKPGSLLTVNTWREFRLLEKCLVSSTCSTTFSVRFIICFFSTEAKRSYTALVTASVVAGAMSSCLTWHDLDTAKLAKIPVWGVNMSIVFPLAAKSVLPWILQPALCAEAYVALVIRSLWSQCSPLIWDNGWYESSRLAVE